MNPDPKVSSRLHVVDESWPIDGAEQFRRFEAGREERPSRPTNPSGQRHRVLTGAVAFAVFIIAAVFAWRGFHPAVQTAAHGPSASATAYGTYILSDFEVDQSTDPRSGDAIPGTAAVTVTQRWSTDAFPGEHRCSLTVLDAGGREIGTSDFQLMDMMSPRRSPMPVDVNGSIEGATATGSCEPNRLDDPVAYETSVTDFAQTEAGIEVTYRVTQPPVVPPWEQISNQACTVAAWADGEVADTAHFTLGVPDGTYQAGIDMDRSAAARITAATVTCEPFAHDRVFPDPSPPAAASPATTSSSSDSARVAVYEALIRYLVTSPDTDGAFHGTVHVNPNLCPMGTPNCGDRLTDGDELALRFQLQDLGTVVFADTFDPESGYSTVVLGPITAEGDAIRVDGGSVCGGLCGSGGTYVVERSGDGYLVTGLDPSQGRWQA